MTAMIGCNARGVFSEHQTCWIVETGKVYRTRDIVSYKAVFTQTHHIALHYSTTQQEHGNCTTPCRVKSVLKMGVWLVVRCLPDISLRPQLRAGNIQDRKPPLPTRSELCPGWLDDATARTRTSALFVVAQLCTPTLLLAKSYLYHTLL